MCPQDKSPKQGMKPEQVTVTGRNNQITLKGRVEELLVQGSNNEIRAEDLGHVTFIGSNNLIKDASPIESECPVKYSRRQR